MKLCWDGNATGTLHGSFIKEVADLVSSGITWCRVWETTDSSARCNSKETNGQKGSHGMIKNEEDRKPQETI
jgi:hypothetical protein